MTLIPLSYKRLETDLPRMPPFKPLSPRPSPLPPSPDTTLSSPSESLFELSTPVDSPLFPSYDVSDIDRALWEWEALENYPSVMELAALGKEAENPKFLQSWQGLQDQIEGLQPSSDVALAA